jgi:homocysteine S-methyltransferase
MSFREVIMSSAEILCEASIIETLKHSYPELINPFILNTSLLFHKEGQQKLDRLYRSFIEISQFVDLPMIVLTPTWKANPDNLANAGSLDIHDVSQAAFELLDDLRHEFGAYSSNIFICGLLGPKGDAYKVTEALDADTAEDYHRIQIESLLKSGVDFLLASTLPAYSEALGLGRAMAKQPLPYVLSFLIGSDGRLLDGKALDEVILELDSQLEPKPLHYWVNCVHPQVLIDNWQNDNWDKAVISNRLCGLQANSSPLSPQELEACRTLQTAPAKILAAKILQARALCGLRILGGCCGTNGRMLAALARQMKEQRQ